jgi:hypothetical protein
MSAATLHQVCGGRYVLGLGASTKALAEGFHDTAGQAGHPMVAAQPGWPCFSRYRWWYSSAR